MNRLIEFVDTARATIATGYYRNHGDLRAAPSLRRSIEAAKAAGRTPIIAEVKPASPTRGTMAPDGGIDGLITAFVSQGATALSVVTEPKHFHGSLANLRKAVLTGRPVLMKDFILEEVQIDCAAAYGASAVLLIASILPTNHLKALIDYAHTADREVLLEVASRKEYERALATEADLIGINNRDLATMRVDLDRTRTFQEGLEREKPLVSMSGFETRDEILRYADVADAFLVGSSLIDGTATVKELVGA